MILKALPDHHSNGLPNGATNGAANGVADGHANGLSNGHANGHMNGDSSCDKGSPVQQVGSVPPDMVRVPYSARGCCKFVTGLSCHARWESAV